MSSGNADTLPGMVPDLRRLCKERGLDTKNALSACFVLAVGIKTLGKPFKETISARQS
jgi:hypothetical protein